MSQATHLGYPVHPVTDANAGYARMYELYGEATAQPFTATLIGTVYDEMIAEGLAKAYTKMPRKWWPNGKPIVMPEDPKGVYVLSAMGDGSIHVVTYAQAVVDDANVWQAIGV